MTKASQVLVVIGFLLMLAGAISKFTYCPIIVAAHLIKPISFVIMANTSFLLALLLKK